MRVPASYQGLWGLRSTHGAVPTAGLVALAPDFDTVGLLTRDPHTLVRATAALVDDAGVAVPDDVVGLDDVGFDLAAMLDPFRTHQGFQAWQLHGDWIRAHPDALRGSAAARFEAASRITPPRTTPPGGPGGGTGADRRPSGHRRPQPAQRIVAGTTAVGDTDRGRRNSSGHPAAHLCGRDQRSARRMRTSEQHARRPDRPVIHRTTRQRPRTGALGRTARRGQPTRLKPAGWRERSINELWKSRDSSARLQPPSDFVATRFRLAGHSVGARECRKVIRHQRSAPEEEHFPD
ncbi:amidase family protein [Luedemannella flava]